MSFEEYKPKEEKSGFQEYKPQEKEKVNPIMQAVQDYGRAAIRGGLKGMKSIGESVSNLMPEDFMGTSTQGEGLDRFNEHLDDKLGLGNTFGAKGIEGVLERSVPMMLPFGKLKAGSRLVRSLLGGLAGEATEGLGGGPLMQAGAEIIGSSAPGAIVNKIIPGNKPSSFLSKLIPKKNIEPKKIAASSGREYTEEAFVDALRDRGFSDNQITPLIQSEGKMKFLAPAANKGDKTQKMLSESRKGAVELYNHIEDLPEASTKIGMIQGRQMLRKMNAEYADLPDRLKQLVKEDYDQFLNSKKTPKDMMRFNRHINDTISSQENAKQIGRMKEGIEFGMSAVSKNLGEEFKLANDVYSRYAGIQKVLSKKALDGWLTKSKIGGAMAAAAKAIVTGDINTLILGLGGVGALEVAGRQMRHALLNPKYQDLGRKLASAIKQNKNVAATSIMRNVGKELAKDRVDPDIVGKFLTFDATSDLHKQ